MNTQQQFENMAQTKRRNDTPTMKEIRLCALVLCMKSERAKKKSIAYAKKDNQPNARN